MDPENDEQQTDTNEGASTETNEPENKAGEGATGENPNEGASTETQKGETVNRHKHEREIGKRDDRIKELEAENAKLKGRDKDVADLTKRLDDMEAKAKTEKVEATLKAAGCVNVKAAIACLDDHEGDVEKLKAAAPYLFTSTDKSKSTGGNPKGKPSDDEDEKLDKAFGLK